MSELVVGGGAAGADAAGGVDGAFEPEAGAQATAEVFDAAKADAAGAVAGGRRRSAAGVGLDVFVGEVEHAEQRDRGLGQAEAAGAHGRQGDKGFHFKGLRWG
jgi:hypothetical protein